MLRFHLDENVDHAIARALRSRGIDVTTATDAGLISAPDEDHVAFALQPPRVIVTHDPDFLRLHATGIEHAGIAFCHSQSRTIGEVVRSLCLMHDFLEPSDVHSQVEYL